MANPTIKELLDDIDYSIEEGFLDTEAIGRLKVDFPEFTDVSLSTPKDKLTALLDGVRKTLLDKPERASQVVVPRETTVIAPKKFSSTLTPVSNSSGVRKMVASVPYAADIIAAINNATAGATVRQVMRALGTINSKCQGIQKNDYWGECREISDMEFASWSSGLKKENVVVGPNILMKVMAQNDVSYRRGYNQQEGAYTEWTRNGHVAKSYDRDDLSFVAEDGMEQEEVITKFLDGFNYQKRQMVYSPVSMGAYRTFDLLSTHYQVKIKDFRMEFTNWRRALQLPHNILNILLWYKDKLEKVVLKTSDADWAREEAARTIDLTGLNTELIAFLENQFSLAVSKLGQYMKKTLEEGESKAKFAALIKMGVKDTTDRADEKLETMRAMRNKEAEINQMVNKNCASVKAHNVPQVYETQDKGRNILEAVRHFGVDPDKIKWSLYGVAYGHMNRVFKELKIDFDPYDVARAKHSNAEWTYGDVCQANQQYIIDDSYIEQIPFGWTPMGDTYTYDHHKIAHFCSYRPKLVVSKLMLGRFNTDKRIERLASILYPTNGQPPFKYVRMFKAGKLHNGEFYIMLSNMIRQAKPSYLAVDFKVISACVWMANDLIDMFQSRGCRLRARRENKASQIAAFCPTIMWQRLLRALPGDWPWYKGSIAVSGGIARDVISADEEVDFGLLDAPEGGYDEDEPIEIESVEEEEDQADTADNFSPNANRLGPTKLPIAQPQQSRLRQDATDLYSGPAYSATSIEVDKNI